ncbi:hypothetical protein HUJ04_005086 [Dendroctonus ponderosae]
MSSGFISEADAAEIRKKRQEEWEKVRKPSDPLVRPEDPYDNRSLFERLQEQKQKKDLEYEEAHKLKNMIKGLDDDEVEFLDLVDRTKLAADRKKEIEEEQELRDYRNRVSILQEKSIDERLQADIVVSKPKVSIASNLNQQKLLKGVVVKRAQGVKRKASATDVDESKTDSNGSKSSKPENLSPKETGTDAKVEDTAEVADAVKVDKIDRQPTLKCVAILPGLGHYDDSSSDEKSSDLEEDLDILGKILSRNCY